MNKRTLELRKEQLDFVLSPDPLTAFVGPQGSGKTYAGCVKALMATGGYFGGLPNSIPVPNVGLVTAPRDILRVVVIRKFLEVAKDAMFKFSSVERSAEMLGGSKVFFVASENIDQIEARNFTWWFGDCAETYDGDVWKTVRGRLFSDGVKGYAWVAINPDNTALAWNPKSFNQVAAKPIEGGE